MNETSEWMDGTMRDIDPKIRARLDEIASPDYQDPARRNLTGLDWLIFLGFLVACAVGFVVWGY